MPLTLIAGEYRVVGAAPDGDSIRFYPSDPTVWTRSNITVKANASGGVQLRLDAIDALETHYQPPHGTQMLHQNPALGDGAADVLLAMLGFTDVIRGDRSIVTSATPPAIAGHILTRFADKYGRAVATVFAGPPPAGQADGSSIYLDVAQQASSVNAQLLAAGWAYPTFYSKLYVDLRAALADSAVAARQAGQQIWAADVTNAGFELISRDQLSGELIILPKLFRRLAEYLALDETGGVDLGGFSSFLQAHGDQLFTVPAGQSTTLATLVEVSGQHVRLTTPPEQIVFIEG